jgi:hypothetical protein
LIEPQQPFTPFNVSFNAGENGSLNGNSFVTKDANSFLSQDEIPQVDILMTDTNLLDGMKILLIMKSMATKNLQRNIKLKR